jgi:hypothetical protein
LKVNLIKKAIGKRDWTLDSVIVDELQQASLTYLVLWKRPTQQSNSPNPVHKDKSGNHPHLISEEDTLIIMKNY